MAGVSRGFVSGDHYDALLTLLDEDLLNADEDFTAEIANVATKIGDLPTTREDRRMVNMYQHTLTRTVSFL